MMSLTDYIEMINYYIWLELKKEKENGKNESGQS